MPFADPTNPETAATIEGVDPHAYVPPELTWTPDLASVGTASLEIDNTVGSVARHMGDRWGLYYARQSGWDAIDDDYEPFDDDEVLAAITERPELAGEFSQSRSRFESSLIRRRIDREDEAHETMAHAGPAGTALMFGTGLIDPVNMLPFGTFYRAFKLGRFARGAAEGATAGLVSGTIAEGVLQSTQMTRTPEESLTNIAASTILSGFLGGAAGLVSPEARGSMGETLKREVSEAQDALNGRVGALQGGSGSGGAAATRATTLADETRVATGVFAERAGELPIVGTPMGRLAESPSLMVRQVARTLTEDPYHYQGEAKGIEAPQAVETRAKLKEGPLYVALNKIDDAFTQYRFGKKVFAPQLRAGVQDIVRRDPNKLTYEQFRKRVTYAARRGDTDPIPEVAAAAKAFREVEDYLKNEGIEVGLFTEDVKSSTAESHVHRVYRTDKIKAQRPTFERIIFEHVQGLKQAGADAIAQVNAWAKIRDKARATVERVEAELKRHEQFDIAGMRAEGQTKRRLSGELQREVKVREGRIEKLQRRLATAQQRQVKVSDRLPTAEEILRGDTAPEMDAAPSTAPETVPGQVRTLADLIPQAAADRTQAAFDRQFTDKKAKAKPKAAASPELKSLVLDLHDARTMKEPQRIIDRIRAMGGVRDLGGELAARGFKPIKKRNGKAMNTKDARFEIIDTEASTVEGRGLDQVARTMHEAGEGYLPLRQAGEEDTDALVAALEADAHGSPVYAEFGPDAAEIARYRSAQDLKAEFERQGIDLNWSNERIAGELGLIEDYVPDTPATRERMRQAGWYERRVADDLAAETKAHAEAVQNLGKATKEAADISGRAQRMRGNVEALKRERSTSMRAAEKFTKLVDGQRDIEAMTDADLRDVARQVTDRVLGYEDAGAIDVDGTANLRGAVLERTLTIPDHRIEDFLENDAEHVLRKYTRQMGADIELTRAFGRADMRDQIDAIRQNYARVREGVTDEKALAAIDKRMKDDIDNLAAIRDRIRGTYGVPKDPDKMIVRTFRTIRAGNYLRLMGGAVTASIPDAGAVVMTHGLNRVMGNGLRVLMTNLKGYKGSADEVRRASVGLDYVLDTRANALADIGDDFGRNSKFERGIEAAQNRFGIVNLLSGWTAVWKQFAGVVGQTRILEEVERLHLGKATKAEIAHLAYLGINYDTATGISLMARKHATVEPGLRIANTAKWDDPDAVTAIRAALRKEVDVTVVTPGAGDKPLWMSTEMGKVIGQFKSFTLSAMSRTTARGLQQRDAAALQGMIMMTGLGMLAYYIKTRDSDIAWDNPAVWVKEGVDRSGVAGWLFEGTNTLEKLLGGVGINAAIGAPSARYMSRNAMGAILGPTAGVGEDAARLLSNIGQGKWSAADTHRIRKLLPMQNLMYLRWLFDRMEEGVNEGLGVPDRRQPFRRRNDY